MLYIKCICIFLGDNKSCYLNTPSDKLLDLRYYSSIYSIHVQKNISYQNKDSINYTKIKNMHSV